MPQNFAFPALPLLVILAAQGAAAQEPPSWISLAPLFEERCTACHSGEGAPLGLQLDTYENALKGSENGPVLLPGEPQQSELLRRVRGESEPQMPLADEPLSGEQLAAIEAWIAAGLPQGEGAVAANPTPAAQPVLGPDDPVNFSHVERIFLQRCVSCHNGANPNGPPEGLSLESYGQVLAGGDRMVVIPGHPAASELMRRIEGKSEPRMPLDGPPFLSPLEIDLIGRWIADGAADAEGAAAAIPVGAEVRFEGLLTEQWAIDGAPFSVEGARIDEDTEVGQQAEMRGVIAADGSIRATRLRPR